MQCGHGDICGLSVYDVGGLSGIDEIDGLVTHHWNGEEVIVPYEEIVQIAIQPYVKYARISNRTDETYFAWRLIFVTEKEEHITYRLWLNDDQPSRKEIG